MRLDFVLILKLFSFDRFVRLSIWNWDLVEVGKSSGAWIWQIRMGNKGEKEVDKCA